MCTDPGATALTMDFGCSDNICLCNVPFLLRTNVYCANFCMLTEGVIHTHFGNKNLQSLEDVAYKLGTL